ncbi:hypothetical protein [Amycolatopsis sp. CA-230715]|uniref:hypothetical protein n=1 Tax=Amycolatopsis sp. CA-230715 TaxID=2745196 RepID=UPI001C018583|nr:hypothetical protein [Amycolatopsis sp. CA-230715]QWF85812.1 hypothetical protein HUW46_09292 [Amycolatopsis sp. CA-230715]
MSGRDRVLVWRALTGHIRPLRVAYWWATAFRTFFTLACLFFIASLIAILGDYSRAILIATLSASAVLMGLPAITLHRVAWQALNVSVGAYVVARDGESDAAQ